MSTDERPIVSSLLVIGPARPAHPAMVAKYEAIVGAGYATRAPLGDDRNEYKITAAGRDYLIATRTA